MNDVITNIIKCSLCGYEYKRENAGCSSCPLGNSCNVICCPHCGYQTIDEAGVRKKLLFIRRFFKWLKSKIL